MEILQKQKVSHRLEYIEQFFDAYDEQSLGYLTYKQSKLFFIHILDLDRKRDKHRKLLEKILKVVDPEKNCFVFKERVLEFFEMSGLQIIDQLCKE